jgi:hypothetical protein
MVKESTHVLQGGAEQEKAIAIWVNIYVERVLSGL